MSLIVVPDTQLLAFADPDHLVTLANWITTNAASLKIAAVLHTGDQVDTMGDATEWNNAEVLFDMLDAANVPYLMAIGNHDYDDWVTFPKTIWNTRYPQSRYTSKSWWSGGFYEAGHSENAYLIIGNYLIISLEFGANDAVLAWAKTIIDANPSKRVWVITHSYEYSDGSLVTTGDNWNPHTYYDPVFISCNDGQEMWTKLIKLCPNIQWVQSAHDIGGVPAARHEANGDGGNKVENVFDNFQGVSDDLRIIKFYKGGNYISVSTYNYMLDSWRTDLANRFDVIFP